MMLNKVLINCGLRDKKLTADYLQSVKMFLIKIYTSYQMMFMKMRKPDTVESFK